MLTFCRFLHPLLAVLLLAILSAPSLAPTTNGVVEALPPNYGYYNNELMYTNLVDLYKHQAMCSVNAQRVAHNLKPLLVNDILGDMAQDLANISDQLKEVNVSVEGQKTFGDQVTHGKIPYINRVIILHDCKDFNAEECVDSWVVSSGETYPGLDPTRAYMGVGYSDGYLAFEFYNSEDSNKLTGYTLGPCS